MNNAGREVVVTTAGINDLGEEFVAMEKATFIQYIVDPLGRVKAIVEREDGNVMVVCAFSVRFKQLNELIGDVMPCEGTDNE